MLYVIKRAHANLMLYVIKRAHANVVMWQKCVVREVKLELV